MRQLHLVGFTSDHQGLIFAPRQGAHTGEFIVTLDADLMERIAAAWRSQFGSQGSTSVVAPGTVRAGADSALSPREIQDRLRAGRSMEAVAAEAGMGTEWVERFAGPVFAEQAAAAARAVRLTLRTPRRGESDRPLAESVLRNLADRGIRLADDEFAAAWTALQHAPDEWLIRFQYQSGSRELDAQWILNPVTGSLWSRNRLATELGFVDPQRHVLPPKEPAKKVGAARKMAPASTATPAKNATAVTRAAPAKKVVGVTTAARAKKVASVTTAAPAKKAASVTTAPANKVAAEQSVAPASEMAPASDVAAPAEPITLAANGSGLDRGADSGRAETGVPKAGR